MPVQPSQLFGRDNLSEALPPDMSIATQRWRIATVAILLFGISLAHFVTSLEIPVAHDVMDRLYYIPIGLAAFWFGGRGGITSGLGSTILFIPHIIQWEKFGHTHAHQDYGNKYVEAGLFPLFGLFIGYLFDSIRARNRALSDAYTKLMESYRAVDRSARLAVLGQVAAGLAHEVRNPLAGLQGAVEALGDQVAPENKVGLEFRRRSLNEISRISSLVSDFVAIGKPAPIEPAPVDLEEIIRDVIALLLPKSRELGIVIELETESDIPELMLDGNKIKQTMMNLILNGVQSMPGGGRVVVSLARSSRDIRIRIRDEGVGIPEADRERIFTPFYSTKEQGTGLGLPLAKQIIEAHGGTLNLEESQGQGATFVVSMPLELHAEGRDE